MGGTSPVPHGVVNKGLVPNQCWEVGWRYCGDTCIEYERRYREIIFFALLTNTTIFTTCEVSNHSSWSILLLFRILSFHICNISWFYLALSLQKKYVKSPLALWTGPITSKTQHWRTQSHAKSSVRQRQNARLFPSTWRQASATSSIGRLQPQSMGLTLQAQHSVPRTTPRWMSTQMDLQLLTALGWKVF